MVSPGEIGPAPEAASDPGMGTRAGEIRKNDFAHPMTNESKARGLPPRPDGTTDYLTNLFHSIGEKTESPAGACSGLRLIERPKTPDAHDEQDDALMIDDVDNAIKGRPWPTAKVCERFLEGYSIIRRRHFHDAWYKLTLVDNGHDRYVGPEVPEVSLPLPEIRSQDFGFTRSY